MSRRSTAARIAAVKRQRILNSATLPDQPEFVHDADCLEAALERESIRQWQAGQADDTPGEAAFRRAVELAMA